MARQQDEVEAELLKNGGEAAMDWLTEVVLQIWQSGKVRTTGMERCHTGPYSQEAGKK